MRTIFFLSIIICTISATAQRADRLLDAKPCFERHTIAGQIKLTLKGIYIDSSLLWIVVRAANRSAIDFRPSTMRFMLRDKHTVRRRALQEIRLQPTIRQEPSILRSGTDTTFYDGLIPRIPGKRQELVIEWVERDGDRRMQLHVPAKNILNAAKLP